MTSVTAANFERNPRAYLEQAVRYGEPVSIADDMGSAVLISEEQLRGMQETMYLHSVPGLAESIIEAGKAPNSEFISMEEMDW